jgi:SAM-dependent methyltransferase
MDYIGSHQPGAALDLGCGTGTNVLALARAGWRATGVDFSHLAIYRARRRLRQSGFTALLLSADVTQPLPLQHSYDLALDIGCFHMLSDRSGYLKNLLRLLAVGGHWLMYGFLGQSGAIDVMGLTSQELDTLASSGLEIVERQDGMYGDRQSAWFLFSRKPAVEPAGDLTPRRV